MIKEVNICVECFVYRKKAVKSNVIYKGNSICDRCLIDNHLKEFKSKK